MSNALRGHQGTFINVGFPGANIIFAARGEHVSHMCARGGDTVILHSCDILSWAPVPSNECRSTGLYGAIKADLEQRASSSTRKIGATCTQLWIEWLPQRVPSNGERLYGNASALPTSTNLGTVVIRSEMSCSTYSSEIIRQDGGSHTFALAHAASP